MKPNSTEILTELRAALSKYELVLSQAEPPYHQLTVLIAGLKHAIELIENFETEYGQHHMDLAHEEHLKSEATYKSN